MTISYTCCHHRNAVSVIASEASNTKPINLAEPWLEFFSLPKLIAKIFGAVSEIKI